MDELRGAMAEAQTLLNAAGVDGADVVRQAHDKVSESFDRARVVIEDLEDDATQYVRDNPWHALGFAAAIGVLVGVLVARRR